MQKGADPMKANTDSTRNHLLATSLLSAVNLPNAWENFAWCTTLTSAQTARAELWLNALAS